MTLYDPTTLNDPHRHPNPEGDPTSPLAAVTQLKKQKTEQKVGGGVLKFRER